MRNETENKGLTEATVQLAAWERPALNRLDAADAEMMATAGSDGMSLQMAGS